MNPKARKIFIATALGTMLGLYSSIAFLPSIVWWFGALIGGISAGLFYSLPEIIRYSPLAFQIAKNDLKKTEKILTALYEIIKIPGSKKWRLLTEITFYILLIFWIFFALTFMIKLNERLAMFSLVLGIFYIVPISAIMITSLDDKPTERETEKIKRFKKTIFFMTPPGFLFLLMLGLVKFVPKAAKKISCFLLAILLEMVRFFATFAKTLFFFVHSKELVLCAIDAGISVLISYTLVAAVGNNLQTGPALLFGGLIGGLLGILHYEIVSVRILRVSR